MIKICHMTSAHESTDVRIFRKECVSLASAGYKVYLVAQGVSYVKDGVQIVGIGKKANTRFDRMVKTTRAIYKCALKLDADVYHLHDPELLPFAIKLKKRGKKVIFDSHENYTMQIAEKRYFPRFIRYLASKLYHYYETYVAKRIDAVIIPCTFEGKNIFENRAKQTVFITNAPFLFEYSGNDHSEDIRKYVCYVGGLSYDRGITHLIKASVMAEASLVLAGGFNSDDYAESIKAMPEFRGVDYRGYISREEIHKLYSQAAIGVCTLLRTGQYDKLDTFPVKVYEYMSMGLPVIITDYPYARAILKDYEFGVLVKPDDVNSISKAIRYLLDNPEIARRMGGDGRNAVIERYNWRIEERKLLQLYSAL